MCVNAAAEILGKNVARHPDRPALLFCEGARTYAQLERDAWRFAALLKQRNVAPQAMVALDLPNCPAFVAAFLGAILHGAVPVPLPAPLPLPPPLSPPLSPGQPTTEASCAGQERRFILENAGAVLLITDDPAQACAAEIAVFPCDLWGPLESVSPKAVSPDAVSPETVSSDVGRVAFLPTPDALAFMLYTSGSTGRPKGVPHRHADLLTPCATLGPAIFGTQPEGTRPEMLSGEVLLSTSSLSFSYGLMAQIGLGLAGGATVVLQGGPAVAEHVVEAIAAHKATVLFSVPTTYDALLRTMDATSDLSSLRCCVSSGEAMSAGLHEAWQQRTGIAVTEVLGSTETFTSFMVARPGRDKPGTLGSPTPGFAVRLVGEDGAEVQDGATGRLLVKGPGMATAYWRRPDRTAEAMRADGWLETGDLCQSPLGQLRHLGRSDDRIRTNGQWVVPSQVEQCLRGHPAVADCAVAACHVRGLAYLCAFVIPLKPPVAATLGGDILRYAKERLARHMCPVKVAFVAQLPRTATGKLQRHRLPSQE